MLKADAMKLLGFEINSLQTSVTDQCSCNLRHLRQLDRLFAIKAVINMRMSSLEQRFPAVKFYNPNFVEVQDGVTIGPGSRVGSFTLIHTGAVIGSDTTIGSHCNICDCSIGSRVSIQTGCHITRGVIIEDDVFIGPHVVMLNDKLNGSGACSFPMVCRGAKVGGGSVLLPGVRIGPGALIGAGSVVTKDIPAGITVFGEPARTRFAGLGH